MAQTNLDRSSRTSSWVACLYEKWVGVSTVGPTEISGDEDDEYAMIERKRERESGSQS
jgi:hypothetical protein